MYSSRVDCFLVFEHGDVIPQSIDESQHQTRLRTYAQKAATAVSIQAPTGHEPSSSTTAGSRKSAMKTDRGYIELYDSRFMNSTTPESTTAPLDINTRRDAIRSTFFVVLIGR